MGTTSTFCGTPEVTISCCLVQKLHVLEGFLLEKHYVYSLLVILTFPFDLMREYFHYQWTDRDAENYRSVLRQIHCDVADKNNGVSFDDLDIHYHWYDSPSYWTCCDTSDNFLPDIHNCYYFIFVVLNDIMQKKIIVLLYVH